MPRLALGGCEADEQAGRVAGALRELGQLALLLAASAPARCGRELSLVAQRHLLAPVDLDRLSLRSKRPVEQGSVSVAGGGGLSERVP
jgi:hypothetical protein